jgi:hypothetical protein
MIKKTLFLSLFLSFTAFVCLCLYYMSFSYELDEGMSEAAGIGFLGFVIPDTLTYLEVVDFERPIESIIFSVVKNTIGPSFIWYIACGKWIPVFLINALFIFAVLRYADKLARLFGVSYGKIVLLLVCLALLPDTLFYSVGALKEIPTLLFITAFFYHYLKREHVKWLLFSLLAVLFRYQLIVPLILFILTDIFRKRSLTVMFVCMMALSAAFPYVKALPILSQDATESYRQQNGETGAIGGAVENVRDTIPGVSVLAVTFRVFQSLFEPLSAFFKSLSFYEDSDLKIWDGVMVLSTIIMMPCWLIFIWRTGLLTVYPSNVDIDVIRLFTFCFTIIFPTAGFSFIHHRYVYPMTALVLLASEITLNRQSRPINNRFRPALFESHEPNNKTD